MYICNENVKILSDLPLWQNGTNKGRVNREAMVGMKFDIEYYGKVYNDIKICNYFIDEKRNPRFSIEYNGVITNSVLCKGFLKGEIGNILNIDLNNKYIDENDVVHIFIKNKNGKTYEALYSGCNVEEVMKANWYVVLKRGKPHSVNTARYKKKTMLLHQVDLGSFVDHINNNPLDNRISNLIKSNQQHNAKNKKSCGKYEFTGLKENGNGWYSRFRVNGVLITTNTKYDIKEAELDNLIAQKHLDYRHNDDMFHLITHLSRERIKEVTCLLDEKIAKNANKTLENRLYNYNIVECTQWNKLILKNNEMIFDKDTNISNMQVWYNNGYWVCKFIENNSIIENKFHKEIMELRANEYSDFNIHIDHINNETNDNRRCNLIITTNYGNQCNKVGKGYSINKNGSYAVSYMNKYRFWDLIGGIRRPTFKTEFEAIEEVERRRIIIENSRAKLKTKQELDDLIQYCLDNGLTLENGLADLDLGYLYWKNIL